MTAREYFEAIGRLVDRLAYVQLLLANDGEDWRPLGISGGEVPDPTLYEAQRRVDRMSELAVEEDDLLEEIGRALVVIEGVRAAMGVSCGDALELRYIDRWGIGRIARESRVSASTVKRRIATGFEYVDTVGFAAASTGAGTA